MTRGARIARPGGAGWRRPRGRGCDHHALAGAVQDLAIVDHAYALGEAKQGLARHIEEIGQPGLFGGDQRLAGVGVA